MGRDNGLDKTKTHARAGLSPAGISAIEPLENVVQIFRCDPDSRILDGEDRPAFLILPQPYVDPAAGIGADGRQRAIGLFPIRRAVDAYSKLYIDLIAKNGTIS